MKVKKYVASLVATLMVTWLAFPTSSYAARTSQKITDEKTVSYTSSESQTVTASKAMSLVLNPGESDYSNIITFNFRLPSNACVTEVKVVAPLYEHFGLGAILPERLKITDPAGDTQEVPWGRGNVTNISTFISKQAAGTWSVSYYGINLASSSSGMRFIGALEYKPVAMTINYILE